MLHLDRKLGQEVVIDVPGYSPITVYVSKVGGKRIHLSFDCLPPIRVDREEIYWSRQDADKNK